MFDENFKYLQLFVLTKKQQEYFKRNSYFTGEYEK